MGTPNYQSWSSIKRSTVQTQITKVIRYHSPDEKKLLSEIETAVSVIVMGSTLCGSMEEKA